MPISSYIGGGIGGGWSHGELTITNGAGLQYNDNISGFARLVGAGVRVGAWNRDVGYRYRNLETKNICALNPTFAPGCCGNGVHTPRFKPALSPSSRVCTQITDRII